MPLEGYEASPGIEVELCSQCRGLFLDRNEIRALVGRGSLSRVTEVVPLSLGDELTTRCPKCVDPVMQPLQVKGTDDSGVLHCATCGGLWLGEGAFFELSRALRASMPPVLTVARQALGAEAPLLQESGLAHSRSRYDEGFENLVAVPLVLLLSWLICSSTFGRLLGHLVGMPFHEVGHAAASWLSSRIAIPLPFFTFWYDDQSILMGFVVAATLGWLMFHTYREENWFMMSAAGVVFTAWAIATFVISPNTTLQWQILAGALGELAFGGFLLIAFHFPLPDRVRWDFWRWVALFPAAICFMQALLMWRESQTDLSRMPWGSALGSDSDGDMNRLVQQFDWTALELAEFYLDVAYLWLAALVVAYLYSGYRFWRRRQASA
jgi:Zn-finger nucleic acid-binding protein